MYDTILKCPVPVLFLSLSLSLTHSLTHSLLFLLSLSIDICYHIDIYIYPQFCAFSPEISTNGKTTKNLNLADFCAESMSAIQNLIAFPVIRILLRKTA